MATFQYWKSNSATVYVISYIVVPARTNMIGAAFSGVLRLSILQMVRVLPHLFILIAHPYC